MNKIKLIFSLLLCAKISIAQYSNPNNKPTYNSGIKPNIFRIILTEPLTKDYETNTILYINYEGKIKSAFSVVGKMGVGVSFKKNISSERQFSYHLYSGAELRYYFTLNRRIRKEKYVQNFSAPYISLEQNIFSNAIALINQSEKEALQGSTNSYLNLGYQIQTGKLYLGAFFGVRLAGKSYSKFSEGSSTAIHAGGSLGFVF